MTTLPDRFPGVHHPYVLFGILLLAFAVRVGYVSTIGPEVRFPDGREYMSYAHHIAETGTFQNQSGDRASRSPGYPVFLSAFLMLFGKQLFLIRLSQALLDTVSVLLLFYLLRTFSYHLPAYLAAGIMSIYPTIVFMTGAILSESILIFSLLFSLLLLSFHVVRDAGIPVLVGAGVSFGLSALIHPSTLLLLPCFLIFLPWVPGLSANFGTFLIGGIAFVTTLAPWTIRNGLVINQWTPGTTKPGQDLYEAFGPGATGAPRGETNFLPRRIHGMSEAEQNRFLLNEALNWMIRNPIRSLRLAGKKFRRTWTPFPNAPSYRRWPYIVVLPVAYLTVLAGAILGFKETQRCYHLLILLSPILYIALLHSIFIGSIRYRIPVMPYLHALAGIGVAGLSRSLNLIGWKT